MIPEGVVELADLLPESVLLVDEAGRIQSANRASAEIVGARPSTLVGGRLHSLVQDPPERVDRYLRLCAGSGETLPGAFTFHRNADPLECRCDGVLFKAAGPHTPAVILLRARPRHESSTRFRALNETIASLWGEIAERQRVEAALRASQELTRGILSSTAECIAVLDLEGRLLSVNEPGRAALDLGDADSYVGTPWGDLWQPEDRATAAQAVADARERGSGTLEGRSAHSPRGSRWWEARITPILDAEQRPERLVAVARDTTERREAEEQLRQSAKMQAIGRLAGGLAHDFNNHLHVQSGLLTFILRDEGLGADSRRDLAEIQAVTDHMASLTRQLLAFSRQQVLRLETMDLNKTVLDAHPLLQRLLGATVEVRLRLSDRPTWVQADRPQLLQVLMNLAINSRDAMRNGGRLEIATGVRPVHGTELDRLAGTPVATGHFVELTVSDTGSGIDPEHLPHIFEPFFTTKPIGEGTGLGLATVHGIVSQSRGYVWAEREQPVGTRFTILFPLDAEPVREDDHTPPTGRGPRRSASVLLVEDDEAVLGVLLRTLETEGFPVLSARHGLEALECLRRSGSQVQLVVSDVSMPVLGGREFVLRLTEEFPEVPVLWISGHPLETDFASEMLKHGHPFLQKPIAPELLLDTIRRTLETRSTRLRLER